MPPRERRLLPLIGARAPGALRGAAAASMLAVLAACQTTPTAPAGPGNVSRLPPGNSERDGPEARPPPNLEAVPDAVPQIEPIRNGGPNKPYEIAGHTYVPLTDDRALTEKGLASWYGKKFHGHRTASGEAYNMYAMTAAHKTLPIPSYARVRNPANGKEVIVRVNDRGPFSPGRVIDLSYTAALKLGVLGGVTPVEISRITDDDIRTGAAMRKPATMAVGDLDRVVATTRGNDARSGGSPARPKAAKPSAAADSVVKPVPDATGDVVALAVDVPRPGVDAGVLSTTQSPTSQPGVDLGAAAAADGASAVPGAVTTTSETVSAAVISPAPASATRAAPARADKPDEHARADTTAGIGWWIQLGAFKQRDGALEFQRRLIDEQSWLAPLLAVFTDHGLNKLQAGPYTSRDDARSAAERIRGALQLVPTIVEKR